MMAFRERITGVLQGGCTQVWALGTWPFRKTFSVLEVIAEFILTKVKTTAQKLVVLALACLTILFMAVLLYAAFLHLYLPTAEIVRPVHFSFSVCPTGHGLCSFPSANITFWNQDGTRKEILGAGQYYRVVLDLDMPDTPTNRNLGMFQVMMQMYDRDGYISAESKRTAMPKYRSLVMRMLDVFVLSPFYFFELMEQKQLLDVELFSYFVDDYYHPSVGAKIEIQSHMIQFYSARLKFFANFSGLKYILYYWPMMSALGGILYNAMIITAFLLLAIYKKAETLRVISQTLELEAMQGGNQRRQDENMSEEVVEAEVSSSSRNDEDKESLDESNQTKSTDQDDADLDLYDLPIVQEPADFLQAEDEQNVDFVAELRHRRIN
ncbi:seipin isoform X2 [Aplysia californica]|uniref:Seipin n=1 Tax=Aplysia californica TaxID=6500 RepID=A0ABM0JNM3_APLCA|nr:seipin isoform X2 [Aplysia californica]